MNYRTAIILLILLAIFGGSLAIGVGAYNLLSMFLNPPKQTVQVVACATDTFSCPNGQIVARVKPSCQFAQCPETATSTKATTTAQVANWAVTGTVMGKVIISPTCPVESYPPKPECEPKGYATELKAYGKDGREAESVKTSSTGTFSMTLPVGTYTLKTVETGLYPRCEEKTVIVSANTSVLAAISCDSGIR